MSKHKKTGIITNRMTLLVFTAQFQVPTTNFKLPKKNEVYSLHQIGQHRDAHVPAVTRHTYERQLILFTGVWLRRCGVSMDASGI